MADVPSNANENCPGTSSEAAGQAAACQGCPNQAICATAPKGPDPDLTAIARRMSSIKHKVLVLSGKGGVGKSTFSAQLAFALAAAGKEVGLLDIDICGPSVPKMLGLEGQEVHQSASGWSPVYVADNLGVMSIGFMLPNPDDAVIWRGPRKNGLIKQFLKDVDWGKLDYLVVDSPPGTSDEHISIAQFLRAGAAPAGSAAGGEGDGPSTSGRNVGGGVDAAVIVTTPQEVSIIDVRKEISFCRKVGLEVLGVVENMAGLQLPATSLTFTASAAQPDTNGVNGAQATTQQQQQQDVTAVVMQQLQQTLAQLGLDPASLQVAADVFVASGGGAAKMCSQLGLRLLGRVPLDPQLGAAAEAGESVFERQQAQAAPSIPALQQVVQQVVGLLEG